MMLLHYHRLILTRYQREYMPRGGYRPGAGGKSTWNHGRTKTIRVPESLADRVLEIARFIDGSSSDAQVEDLFVLEAGSKVRLEASEKVIDLSGVSIHAHKYGPAVYLSDLIRVGYSIKPERLARNVKPVRDYLDRNNE